jgi:hypothetical protein
MYILVVFISIILLIAILLSTYSLKIDFSFDSKQLNDFKLTLSWLKPFIKGFVKTDENKLVLSVYLFNRKILTKNLTSNKPNKPSNFNNLKLIRSIKFVNLTLKTSYGFEDPSITGMLCGAINILSEYIDINNSCNNPDFSTDFDHFDIYILAEINLLVTLLNLIKLKKPSLVMQKLHVSK